jgi:endonuclease YncB( thermonuclease family)
MGRDLRGLKKKSRPGGALPEAGQKDGQGKGGTLASHRIAGMEIRSRLFPWLLALALFLLPATAAAWSGKVVGVIDGDSITVLHDGSQEQIRLYGIDCPEKRQEFGNRAKQLTSSLVFGKLVEVEPMTVDRYGRTVAFVRVGNILVNEELIRQGLAWVYIRYCDRPICQEWKELEAEAKKARRGLWSMPNPVPPWEFRRRNR